MFQSDIASVLDDAKAFSDTGEKHASFVVNEFADLIGQIHTFLSLYFFRESYKKLKEGN